MAELLVLAVVFVMLSGLMALIEASIFNISRAEVEEMVTQGRRGAGALRSLTVRLSRAVIVIVILTNTINILGPILVGQKAIALFGSVAIGIVTALLTFATIIFSEIIPKSLGAHYAPQISPRVAPMVLGLTWLLLPIVAPLEWLTNLLKSGERSIGTEEQIRSLTRIGRKAGHIESDEGQLIHRAFLLNDKTAADVMTPLQDVISVPDSATIRQAANQVFRHTYSRYPVLDPSTYAVHGILLSHDILEALSLGNDDAPVTTIMRPPLIIPADKRCDNLLTLFRDKRVHLAIVRTTNKTVGLVTLEDVLEELVGEIEDEQDTEDAS